MTKNILKIFFLLFFLSLTAQEDELALSKNIKVSFEKNVDSTQVWIMLDQNPNLNSITYQLYPKAKSTDTKLPKFPSKPGIYSLHINYGMKFHSRLIIDYKNNLDNESLKFHFSAIKDRIFCDVSSSNYRKLNKKVKLKKVNLKPIQRNLDKLRKKHSAIS